MKWEYLIKQLTPNDPEALSKKLSSIGDKGWELIVVTPGNKVGDVFWVFKRPVR